LKSDTLFYIKSSKAYCELLDGMCSAIFCSFIN